MFAVVVSWRRIAEGKNGGGRGVRLTFGEQGEGAWVIPNFSVKRGGGGWLLLVYSW